MSAIQLIESFSEFPLSPTLEANQKAQILRERGKTILHMGFGESPFPVPQRLQDALAAHTDKKMYLPTSGLDDFKATVKSYYKNIIGFDDNDYDVLIAPGSKLILYALQMAVEGDLILPVPSWVSYTPQSNMLGREVIKVHAELSDIGYRLEPKMLNAEIEKTKANGKNPRKIILNYPSNPTGLTIPQSNLEEIAEICRKHGILIISDEIYGLVDFNHDYRSIASIAPDITAVTTGLSKHLSLGGWRVGVGLIPKAVNGLNTMLNNIASETWSAVPAPIQYASVEAYKGHQDIEDHITACTNIHGLMNTYIAERLSTLGITCPRPQGAFYNYPDFAPFKDKLAKAGIKTNKDLADALLEKHNILTLPGIAFGEDESTLKLRLSGCDYDGAKALAAYQNGAALDEDFIKKYAPNVINVCDGYAAFIQSL